MYTKNQYWCSHKVLCAVGYNCHRNTSMYLLSDHEHLEIKTISSRIIRHEFDTNYQNKVIVILFMYLYIFFILYNLEDISNPTVKITRPELKHINIYIDLQLFVTSYSRFFKLEVV